MNRRIRKRLRSAVPLTFFAIPAAGGALAYGLPPSCATLTATSNRLGLSGHSPREGKPRSDGRYSVRLTRRVPGGVVGSAVQMTAFDTDLRTASEARLSKGEGPPGGGTRQQQQQQRDELVDGASRECQLRRGLRNLGQLRKPQNVLEFLAVAKERGDPISLRVFNTAITAVAPCEEGCRYALRILVLMQEEKIAPDRFTLSAIVASCIRCRKWDVAYGVLQNMQREGIRPLDMRPSRFTTAPGEPGEERDRVLRLLQHLRSSESLSPQGGSRPAAAAEFPPSPDGRAIGGRGASDGARSRGVSGQASRRRGQQQTGTGTKGDGKGLGAKSLASPENRRSPPSGGGRTVGELMAAGIRPRQEAFLYELKGAAITKSWEGALKLLDGLREAGYQPQPGAYACAIRACGKAGKWEQSLALMDEMRSLGIEPGEGCNVMALKACAQAGLWEKTLEMLKGMRASGVNRSESTFVVAMKACGDAGRWEEALVLMDDMRKDGVPPMETTYTTAMKACGNAGKWEEALKLFQEMQDIGIPPAEQCFTAAIRACAKADNIEKAHSLLVEMRAARGVSTNMSSYRAVMDAYCRAGDWASAQGLLEDARRDQLKPGAVDLRNLVEACGKAEQHERALSLLEEMRSEGMNLRRAGEKLWWVFNTCRDKEVKDRAWLLMEVEETRERLRLRAERNSAKKKAEEEAAAAASASA